MAIHHPTFPSTQAQLLPHLHVIPWSATASLVSVVVEQTELEEGESMSSKKLSHRIRQEQQKIESRAFGTDDAESAAEWMDKNCP